MSYERHQKPSDSKGSDPEAAKTEPTENAPETRLPTASEVDQLGMTEVVKDLLEHKADTPPANAGLTTTRYSNDSSPAKGLLLNKKAE